MTIGLIDVDGHNYPNLALMKLSAWHKSMGDEVEWYDIFGQYDRVYMAKVFTHTADFGHIISNAKEIVRGGTGYDVNSRLPQEAEKVVPDYSLYPFVDDKTAYGFLTRGCIRKCPWCIVPKKEGAVYAYQDVEEIAVNGRTRLVLMDNNILALRDYAEEQFAKIIKNGYRVDFNQGLDARLVDDDMAKTLASMKWIKAIRFGCDTPKQVEECDIVIDKLRSYGFKDEVLLYTMIYGDINECYARIGHWRDPKYRTLVVCQAQPQLDFTRQKQNIPQWQKDMAHWANKRWLYFADDFLNFTPRKGFRCREYFKGINV